MKYTQSEMEARLAELRRSYMESLRDKSETLTELWTQLNTTWDEDSYRGLFMILHSLAGSAETFGLAEVSADARVLAEALRPLAESPAEAKTVLPDMDKDFSRLMTNLGHAFSQVEES